MSDVSLDNVINLLNQSYLFREKIITRLCHLIINGKWPFIFLSGPKSTGKTCITKSLLNLIKIPYSWTNCFEISSIKWLQKKLLSDFNQDNDEISCHTNHDFIQKFVEIINNQTDVSQIKKKRKSKMTSKVKSSQSVKYLIALDNFDHLIDNNINILPLIFNIIKTLGSYPTLTCIFISNKSFDFFLPHFGSICCPIVIEFPSYSSKELSDILSSNPLKQKENLYRCFASLIVDNASSCTNQLNQLAFICESNFDKFSEPLNGCKMNTMSLWNKFNSHLDECVNKIAVKMEKPNMDFDLPISTKYLLISAYLASYNPPASDRQYFVTISNSRKVAFRQRKSKSCVGPKYFPLERLLHIYQSLVSNNHFNYEEAHLDEPLLHLFSQIETMISLKLLIRVNSSTFSMLSSLAKYRISDSVTFKYIDEISKTINFQIKPYLASNN